MTRRAIAKKLREALLLMNDTGRHWVKGEYQEELYFDENTGVGEYGFCSLGAIRYVTGSDMEVPTEESTAVALALAQAIPEVEQEDAYAASDEERFFNRIVRWNDHDDRTWEQVEEKFMEVADSLEAAERSRT